jgi:molybdopterin adenylyltransferase
MHVGILTISDRVARGEMEDRSGMAIAEALSPLQAEIQRATLPDDRTAIADLLRRWSDSEALDVILTTGGTGLGPRDVTPEATLDVITTRVPGIEEALRTRGLQTVPTAMLSRGVAGVRARTLIVNLPGSPNGAREGAELLVPVLPHAVALLHGITRHTDTHI